MSHKWLLSGVSALVASGVLAITQFSSTTTHHMVFAKTHPSSVTHTGPTWGTHTLASLAENVAKASHDMRPTSSMYFVTRRRQGNSATSGARVDGGSMPVDIVVMHGTFSNPKWSTAPLGAPIEKGNTLVVIVNAKNGHVVDMGMMNQTPHQAAAMRSKLSKLSGHHPLTVSPNS